MESKDTTSKTEEQGLKNVKSHYIILKFFEYLTERKYLETIRYNKSIQKRINININHYKAYYETKTSIELDIIPMNGKCGDFIKIKEENKKYFHIYFNDNKAEIKKTELNKEDKVSKINIIIDYQIKSFKELNINNFNTNNVTDMSDMFYKCLSLKELNLNILILIMLLI